MACCALPRYTFPLFLKSRRHTSACMGCCAHPHCIFPASSMEHLKAGGPNLLSVYHKNYFPLVLRLARSFSYAFGPRQGSNFMDRKNDTMHRSIQSGRCKKWWKMTIQLLKLYLELGHLSMYNQWTYTKKRWFFLKKRWKHTLRRSFYHYKTYEKILKSSF